jgi:hypothetical protein
LKEYCQHQQTVNSKQEGSIGIEQRWQQTGVSIAANSAISKQEEASE